MYSYRQTASLRCAVQGTSISHNIKIQCTHVLIICLKLAQKITEATKLLESTVSNKHNECGIHSV